MRLSIRWKWLFAHFLIGSLVLVFIVFYLGSRLRGYFESRFENRWQRELALAKKFIEAEDFESWTPLEADHWTDQIGKILGMRVTL
ncbi:MAG: hypothetical protein ACE5HI_11165, partial [bacterium]